ncbi:MULTISPECIES: hypothetical protein [unclassified Microcoleus]|uniref:hypothetical protein n=1 Tax=unclassified Microcoleus TaxID=2642155 RepID=UPI002FD25671
MPFPYPIMLLKAEPYAGHGTAVSLPDYVVKSRTPRRTWQCRFPTETAILAKILIHKTLINIRPVPVKMVECPNHQFSKNC